MSSEDVTLTAAAAAATAQTSASEAAPPSVDLLHSMTSANSCQNHHHHHRRRHLCPHEHCHCESSLTAGVSDDVGYPQTRTDDLMLDTDACHCCSSDSATDVGAARDYNYLPRYDETINACSAVVVRLTLFLRRLCFRQER